MVMPAKLRSQARLRVCSAICKRLGLIVTP